MMPPHLDQLTPPPGTPLTSERIVLEGHSLRYAEEPQAYDDTLGLPLAIRIEMQLTRVGRGLEMDDPPPGSIQERSVLTITLPALIPGHVYRLEYLGETHRWPAA